jgi:hypothetical protein
MKKLLSSLLMAVAICAAGTSGSHVSRASLKAMESSIDQRIKGLWDEAFLPLIGATRAVYLDGYGVVFTAEVSPIPSMTSMMHPTVAKEEAVKAHKTRIERVAQLKQAMRLAVADAAASLDPVPADEQITMVVFLAYNPWEDVSGTPAQLTVQGKKKALIEARRAGGAALAQAAVVTEN